MARVKTYYGFDGAAQFPETMYWWGLPNNGDYGWNNRAPEPANSYIRRYWNGGLELVGVMLDRYDDTQDEQFARDTLVPLADPLINFLDQYWLKRDLQGKIRFEPAQSLETWHVAVNPLPEIAGLHYLLPRLLSAACRRPQPRPNNAIVGRKCSPRCRPYRWQLSMALNCSARPRASRRVQTRRTPNSMRSFPIDCMVSAGPTWTWQGPLTNTAAIVTTAVGARTAFRPPASA